MCCRHPAGGKQWSAGPLHLMVRISSVEKKNAKRANTLSAFLVRVSFKGFAKLRTHKNGNWVRAISIRHFSISVEISALQLLEYYLHSSDDSPL